MTPKAASFPGFPKCLLQFVRCPHDGAELELANGYLAPPGDADSVQSGRLVCRLCSAVSFLDGGILKLLSGIPLDEAGANELQRRNSDRATVGPMDTPTRRMQNEMEMLPTLEALPVRPEHTVLELGCGEGRYTLPLAARTHVLAVDFSIELLRILQSRLPANARNVGLVLGDITTLKVAPQKFDFALSTLTSNLPSRQHREALYHLARTALAPRGSFVFSSHLQGIRQRLAGEKKSGYYKPGGIYRYNFGLREAIAEVQPYFRRVHVRPIQIHFPLARTLGLPVVRLSRLLERVPVLNLFGMLLLGVATEPHAPLESRHGASRTMEQG